MLRQSIGRCARLRSAAVAPIAPKAIRQQPSLLRPIQRASTVPIFAVSRNGTSSSRWYSAEAEAVSQSSKEGETPDQPTRFDQLGSLGVHRNVINTITKKFGYETMSQVQAKTIAPALRGTDLVAQAKTGTGKTLGFLIPIIQRMLNDDPSLISRKARFEADSTDIRGIILSPTRELAEQIAVEAERLLDGTGLVVQRAVGGTAKTAMLQRTRRMGCHLLVATPGRLNDLLSDPNSGIAAPNLSAMVLDEADRMLDVGFAQELDEIVSMLPERAQVPRQTLLFSATIPMNVVQLARKWMRPDNFDFIQTVNEGEDLTHEKVKQQIVTCEGFGNVLPSLFEIVTKEVEARRQDPERLPFKAIVFLPSTAMVESVSEIYNNGFRRNLDMSGYRIHSRLTQNQRTAASDFFRKAKSGILFSSDVTARGLDFPNVTHVFQIGAPPDREQYVHRLGRTGRQDKEGEGWLIIPQTDLQLARHTLGSLPIKPNRDIASASQNLSAEDRTPETDAVMEAMHKGHMAGLAAMYKSLFGRVDRKQLFERAAELKYWFVHGAKFPYPPGVMRNWASKMNLGGSPDVNTGADDIFSDLPTPSDSRHSRGGNTQFFRENDRHKGRRAQFEDQRSQDPFTRMEPQGGFRRRPGHQRGRNNLPRSSF